jgi:hypothetical protein
MFVMLVGLCFLLILTYFTYEAARKNGYNSFFWSAAAFFTFLAVFVFFFLAFGVVMVIGAANWGWTTNTLGGIGELILFLIFALSAGSTTPILWYVNKKRGEAASINLPPPPPDFNQ